MLGAASNSSALHHAPDSERIEFGVIRWRNPATVIPHLQFQVSYTLTQGGVQPHPHVRSARMFTDIGKRLLENPEHRNCNIGFQVNILMTTGDLAWDAKTFGKFPCLPVNCGDNAKIHDARTKVPCNALDRVHRTIHHLRNCTNFRQ